jgi:hypothetical protein
VEKYVKVGNVLHARFGEVDIFDIFNGAQTPRDFREVLDQAYEETFGNKRLRLLPSIEE